MPDKPVIRPAKRSDVARIAACVSAAYSHYIPRMEKPPAPMLEDYEQVIQQSHVSVIEHQDEIIGVIVLAETDEGFLLDNIAVHPRYQGQGIGRKLLEFAENQARKQGFKAIYLCTNVVMTENQALYSKIGYCEYDRRNEKGYSRVYMRKSL